MKKLNLVVGVVAVCMAGVLVASALLSGKNDLWPDAVLLACMGVICISAAVEK